MWNQCLLSWTAFPWDGHFSCLEYMCFLTYALVFQDTFTPGRGVCCHNLHCDKPGVCNRGEGPGEALYVCPSGDPDRAGGHQ